jgi:parvulin-like peptidyl-prolyl isomerase
MKIGWLASLTGAVVCFFACQLSAAEPDPAQEVKVATADAAETPVLEAGDIKILAKDVWAIEKKILENLKKSDPQIAPKPQERAMLRQQLVQARLGITLIQKLAKEHPAELPKDAVDNRMKQLEEMLKTNKVDMEDFVIGKGCLSVDEFRSVTAAGMTLERSLSKDVSDEEVQKAFDQRSASLKLRRCSHVLYSYQGTPNGTATRSKDEAKKLAEDVLVKVKADPKFDFAQLARETSDCPSGKNSGGDLDFSPREGEGQMVKEFAEALYKLPDVGAYSDVVETQFGFHVIKLTEMRKADEFMPVIRQQMTQQKIGKMLQQIMGEKQKETKINTELLAMLPPGETPPTAEPKKDAPAKDDPK